MMTPIFGWKGFLKRGHTRVAGRLDRLSWTMDQGDTRLPGLAEPDRRGDSEAGEKRWCATGCALALAPRADPGGLRSSRPRARKKGHRERIPAHPVGICA